MSRILVIFSALRPMIFEVLCNGDFEFLSVNTVESTSRFHTLLAEI